MPVFDYGKRFQNSYLYGASFRASSFSLWHMNPELHCYYTDFNTKVEDFVRLTEGTDCKIYPAIHPIICWGDEPGIMNIANYRGAAQNFYASGADGLETYNYQYHWGRRIFSHRPKGWEAYWIVLPSVIIWNLSFKRDYCERAQWRRYLLLKETHKITIMSSGNQKLRKKGWVLSSFSESNALLSRDMIVYLQLSEK